MHEALAPIAFLLGTWRGEGTGNYPTIAGFSYGEEIRFWEVGKPFLAYTQRTWALADEQGQSLPPGTRPMHSEAGYWRPQPGGHLEVVLAHPTGVAEIQEGAVKDGTITLAATALALTSSAKQVDALTRRFELAEPDVLRYEIGMAAAGQPLQVHLRAELHRIDD
jgi:hypothetical protein